MPAPIVPADLLAPPVVPRPGAEPAPPPAPAEELAPGAPLVLTAPPPKPLSKAKAAALAAMEMGLTPDERREHRRHAVALPTASYVPAKEISPEALAELEAAGAEVVVGVPAELVGGDEGEGEVVLVPRPTGKPGRLEVTYRQAATIRMLVDVFPGARVVFFGKDAATVANASDEELSRNLGSNGLLCADCREPQFETPSGATCRNGHGGSPGIEPARKWICPHCGNIADAKNPGWCVGGHRIAADTASSQQSASRAVGSQQSVPRSTASSPAGATLGWDYEQGKYVKPSDEESWDS